MCRNAFLNVQLVLTSNGSIDKRNPFWLYTGVLNKMATGCISILLFFVFLVAVWIEVSALKSQENKDIFNSFYILDVFFCVAVPEVGAR